MYIEEKYWNNYIGDTDDSLTLVEYLAEKQKEEITVGEIFSDFGLDRLNGDFKSPDIPLAYTTPEGWEMPVYYAIDVITDVAALLLECKVSGHIDLRELEGEAEVPVVRITASPEEHDLINRTLADFVSAPLAYDLSEMCSEEEMQEMAEICEALRKELY